MAVNNITKKAKTAYIIFGILHLLCLLGPFFYFIPYAFITGTVVSKIALSLTSIVSLILAFIALIVDTTHRAGIHRSIMWTLISGILFCLTSIRPFIWIMATTSIFDELVFSPLKVRFKTKYQTNKEIDKRLS